LSARDIDAVKRVFPSLPPDREGAWLDLFDLGALSVTIDGVQLVELRGDTADVTFRQTIEESKSSGAKHDGLRGEIGAQRRGLEHHVDAVVSGRILGCW
jgi:hypothetical protein